MKMHDLFDMELYSEMLANKYVRSTKHPEFPLWILNYTEHAQFDRVWNPVTLQTRGLIINAAGKVIARPFDKFFNYGEPMAPDFGPDTPVEVTDKMDGSLGILWQWRGHQGIATRGSFSSEQAIHATEIWNRKYKYNMHVPLETTLLFEIIYPDNRIVLDYGHLDDLVLIGWRDIEDGSERPVNDVLGWKWRKTPTYPYKTLQEALESPSRVNAEGYVLRSLDSGQRIKLKQADYVQLHKIVTGLTKRAIWQYLRDCGDPRELALKIPDEWHAWLTSTCEELYAAWATAWHNVHRDYHRVCSNSDGTRKSFAIEALKYNNSGLLFSLLDGRDIYSKVWDLVKPVTEE